MKRMLTMAGYFLATMGTMNYGIAEPTKDNKTEKYSLVYKMEKGQKRNMTYDLSMSGEVKVTTFGRHPLMKFSSKVSRSFTEQVTEAKGTLPDMDNLKLKRDYTASSITVLEPVKPEAAMDPGPEKKKENTIKDGVDLRVFDIAYGKNSEPTMKASFKKKTGAQPSEPENLDEADNRRRIIPVHEADFGLFMPQSKVAVGDEWDVKSDIISSVLALHDGRPVRYVHQSPEVGMRFNILEDSVINCALDEVVTVDDIQCARIKVSGKLVAIQDDVLNNEITLSGFIYFAIKKGMIHKVELDGDMIMTGEYPGRPTDKGMALRCIVQGRGKMSLKLQSK